MQDLHKAITNSYKKNYFDTRKRMAKICIQLF